MTKAQTAPCHANERRDAVKSYADAAPAQIGRQPGQALFRKACASCHTVGKGDVVGPDLKGVTKRRERAWLARVMAAPDQMRAPKDPVAVELAAKYEGALMPDLGLSKTDVADLIAYFEAQTAAIERK